jgi:hypothetical protein
MLLIDILGDTGLLLLRLRLRIEFKSTGQGIR